MGGTAYGILPDSSAFLKNFAERYQLRLAEVAARSPAIDLVEKTARQLANYPAPFAPNPSAPTAAALAPLELAAEHLNVPADHQRRCAGPSEMFPPDIAFPHIEWPDV